ncbi:hypothetical protein FCL40_11600 [Ferrimonas sediminicola]|uniref:Uncharacterized protein n=1 Tax=Ferrimonas sediminicola TaxID=2569538 RepID=A0A4U1BEN1_9GAMM|nr:TapY2 family type IVa secretion system protein [Ferrimonas sediminicola]TKB48784.1 hypothetical protein FCL40_11600 [Ferrimonas sediminicola]
MKLLWMILPLVVTQPVRTEYKCWIEDSAAQQRILFYLWQPQRALTEQARLPGRPLVGEQLRVSRVMECQPSRSDFHSPKARALERLTPR